MNILLTNDDSVDSTGIWILRKYLADAGHKVFLVAPAIEKSANSHAITIREPLRIKKAGNIIEGYKIEDDCYSVSGTPVDSVIVAFEEILKNKVEIDLVISGINAGQNLGDDLLYSGTVAAAIEAMCFGYKAIAVSTTSYENQRYDTASHIIKTFIENGITDLIGHREILNINIPNLPLEEINSYKITQVGFRRYQNILYKNEDHRKRTIYWIGGDNPIYEKSDYLLDFEAIKQNSVSISPVKVDFNNYDKFNKFEKWIESI